MPNYIYTATGVKVQIQEHQWYDIPGKVDDIHHWFSEVGQKWHDFTQYVPHERTWFYDFCGWLFEKTTHFITFFPVDIIASDRTAHLAFIFSGLSVGMIAICSMFEGLKGIMGMQYTKLTTLIGRTVFSMIGAGLTIPCMIFIMNFLNLVIEAMLKIGHHGVSPTVQFSSAFSDLMNEGVGNFFIGVVFMIAYMLFCGKMLLETGRRWFDMIVNAVASPIAWASSVTDSTRSFFYKWLQSTTGLYLTNLVYAFYLTIIMMIVMSPFEDDTAGGAIARILLLVGSVWRLSTPPDWVRSLGGDHQGKSMMKAFMNMTLLGKLRKLK